MYFENTTPIYLQLMEEIKTQIISGRLAPGERLLSVREWALKEQVNPNTMQRALSELEREGLLVGGGTTGRTVTTEESVLATAKNRILQELARECADKFLVFGIQPREAAELLLDLAEMKEV